MKTEHTPEPWRVGRRGNDVVGSNGLGDTVAMMIDCDSDEQTHANARRIVACVNACEDILDYELSLGCVARLSEQLRTITKQRDELLAELQRFMDSHEECTDFDGFTAQIVSMADYHQAQEAIARAKGEQ